MLKVANRTLDIIEYMCSSNESEFRLNELCDKFNINKTIMHRTLRVLTERGYLKQIEKRGSYSVTLKMVELGAQTLKKVDFIFEVTPHMESLSNELKETINLGVLHDKNVVFIYKIDSPHFLRIDLRVGTSVPSYCTALGKAILAWLPKNKLKELFANNETFEKFTPNTISNYSSLMKELEIIKNAGYALDKEEFYSDIICIAAPIFNKDEEVACAISVSGPSTRLKHDNIQYITERLIEQVSKIRINYSV